MRLPGARFTFLLREKSSRQKKTAMRPFRATCHISAFPPGFTTTCAAAIVVATGKFLALIMRADIGGAWVVLRFGRSSGPPAAAFASIRPARAALRTTAELPPRNRRRSHEFSDGSAVDLDFEDLSSFFLSSFNIDVRVEFNRQIRVGDSPPTTISVENAVPAVTLLLPGTLDRRCGWKFRSFRRGPQQSDERGQAQLRSRSVLSYRTE
jgi:hypothetical protein